MADIDRVPIWLAPIGQIGWVAATGRAPYFCFLGDSEATVSGLAARAREFYISRTSERDLFYGHSIGHFFQERGREVVSPEYAIQKKVLGRDLAAHDG